MIKERDEGNEHEVKGSIETKSDRQKFYSAIVIVRLSMIIVILINISHPFRYVQRCIINWTCALFRHKPIIVFRRMAGILHTGALCN